MEIQNNIKSIKELQDEVATMRKDGPQYYSDLLKKEFEAMKNNLEQSDFKGIDAKKVEVKPNNQNYIVENLQDHVTLDEKLIQLNAKCDSLAKCMEYMKE